jgi:hypothetical protein
MATIRVLKHDVEVSFLVARGKRKASDAGGDRPFERKR